MIARDRVAAVLTYLGAKVADNQRRNGWVISTCPFAPWKHDSGIDRHPSFGVSVEASTHVGRAQVYHCFSCQATGKFEGLPFDVREHYTLQPKGTRPPFGKALEIIVAEEDDEIDFDNLPEYDEPVIDPNDVIVWPEWYLASFKSVFSFEPALMYLNTRQITEPVVKRLDLRYDTSRSRVCFPIRDFDGRLVGLHGRHISDHPMPYYAYGYEDRRNKLPWLGEQWLDYDKPVLLVESVFDLASVLRVYDNAACGLSAGLSKAKCERIDGAVQYITLYDTGTGGDRARETLTEYIKAPLRHLPVPKGKKDPGEMTQDELVRLLKTRLPLD